jgi:hypothetical protein
VIDAFILTVCLSANGCKPVGGYPSAGLCESARKAWLAAEHVDTAALNRSGVTVFCNREPTPAAGSPAGDLGKFGTDEPCPIVIYQSVIFRPTRYLELGCPTASDFWKEVEKRLR